MYYSEHSIRSIEKDFATVEATYSCVLSAFVSFPFRNAKAREFAQHGLARRIWTVARCIHKTFELIPPASEVIPTADDRKDAEIFIQAFVFSAYGCLDNLAWIYAHERDVRTDKGKAIAAGQVGLGPSNTLMRSRLSLGFRDLLVSYDTWFEHLEDYRHALAHRIPLYIPPYSQSEDGILFWIPAIKHSWSDPTPPVSFHPQMLADFKTVVSIADRMLAELAY